MTSWARDTRPPPTPVSRDKWAGIKNADWRMPGQSRGFLAQWTQLEASHLRLPQEPVCETRNIDPGCTDRCTHHPQFVPAIQPHQSRHRRHMVGTSTDRTHRSRVLFCPTCPMSMALGTTRVEAPSRIHRIKRSSEPSTARKSLASRSQVRACARTSLPSSPMTAGLRSQYRFEPACCLRD